MAKYTGPVCRLCRREGEKLFLKGSRCFTPKCSFEKRGFAPGQHGRTRQGRSERESDYARQLRAKQRARRVYGMMERPFRRYYQIALHARGLSGLNLLRTLETRLDNVVYRMGYAENRAQARQLVNHGHFTLNGRYPLNARQTRGHCGSEGRGVEVAFLQRAPGPGRKTALRCLDG
jgi:small subunit ribosomal protein S4